MSQTNETTRKILKFLFDAGIFAYRNSVGGGAASYTAKDGSIRNRFVQFGKSGSPDIIAIIPITTGKTTLGVYMGVEVKTGKDRMSELQESFHLQAKQRGAIMLVVKTYEDFLLQWEELKKGISLGTRAFGDPSKSIIARSVS